MAHLVQSLGLQCGFFQADPIHHWMIGTPPPSTISSCSSSSASGLGLAMCTGGHAIRLRNGPRKLTGPVKASCCERSGREAREDEGVNLSGSGAERRWVVATLAAMAMAAGCAAVGEPALAFGWFGQRELEKDPVEPFTIYGSIFKKYLIEDVVEGKVVGRKKGFTASACVNALDASKETPELQGVPAGLKVTIIGEPSCSKGEGQTREESCTAPCRKACQAAVSQHLAEVKEETGYVLDQSDVKKVTEACSSQCFNECTKPGKSISFVFPFRPH